MKIPSIKAEKNGQTAFTREIGIQVSEQAVDTDDTRGLFAKAFVRKKNLVAGEQTVYTLKFFTSKRLSGLRFGKRPGLNDFITKPFEKEKTYTLNINGVLHKVTEINYLIIPDRQGVFKIDPAVLIARVMVQSENNSVFDSFFNDSFFTSSSSKPVRVVSNPVKVNVSSLPPYKGKKDFSGLVGSFDIKADIDKTKLKAKDSATLTIKISGTGNIQDSGLPDVAMQGGRFKIYDDNPVEKINLTV